MGADLTTETVGQAWPVDLLLADLAMLAARLAGTSAALIHDGIGAVAGHGLPNSAIESLSSLGSLEGLALGIVIRPDLRQDHHLTRDDLVTGCAGMRFMAVSPLASDSGEPAGFVAVLDPVARPGLTDAESAGLNDITRLIAGYCAQRKRHLALAEDSRRAIRADRMLRLVSEAVSCADALTSLLGELCRHHGAPVGRIWRLSVPGGLMQEVSRFNTHPYYMQLPNAPVRAGNSMTAMAIGRNEPQTVIYSRVAGREHFALMAAAVASGLQSQVSYPIWVQDQRFGVALAFATEREDLDAIVADIASLANTIRPALFRKVTEERIRFMAHHDDLTQLGNRAVFNECLEHAVASAKRGEHGLALLFLDLDGFKRVNDMRGHEVGDKLLAAVAGRLRAGVREADTVARIGGDEFAVVQPCNGQPYAALQLGQRLVQMLRQPFEIDGQPSMIGVSIGIALFPGDGETPDALLRNADAALYGAKAGGRNQCRLFDPSLAAVQEESLLIDREITQAVEQKQFTLAYQPIYNTDTLQLCGLEALLRWTHPAKGALTPKRFVQLAEASGLMVPLGQWALETACAEAASWAEPVCVSVNLSPLQFRHQDLAAEITATLARTGLSPTRLDLEITEGSLLDDAANVLLTIGALRDQGIRLTLDHFGTASASLSTLRRFPFDQLKIDMSFIQGMCDDNATMAIVEGILSLGARLRLDVVAEGVETEQQLEILRKLGCARVQGYLTGRPVAPGQVQSLMSGTRPAQMG